MNFCFAKVLQTSIFLIVASFLFRELPQANADTGRDALWGTPQASHYQTIRQPASKLHSKHAVPTFTVSPKTPLPYAYGWFGQKQSPSWYRQFGHQQNYTQWTLR